MNPENKLMQEAIKQPDTAQGFIRGLFLGRLANIIAMIRFSESTAITERKTNE